MPDSHRDRSVEPPPPEAYGRVTDAERFRPLISDALRHVDRLASLYDVSISDTFPPLPWLARLTHSRPPITLAPMNPGAATIGFAFTAFPGLIVRFGRWSSQGFPGCGCDACAEYEHPAEECGRLGELLDDVVAGRFTEELRIPLFGSGSVAWSMGSGGQGGLRGGSLGAIPRDQLRAALGQTAPYARWAPWPERAPSP